MSCGTGSGQGYHVVSWPITAQIGLSLPSYRAWPGWAVVGLFVWLFVLYWDGWMDDWVFCHVSGFVLFLSASHAVIVGVESDLRRSRGNKQARVDRGAVSYIYTYVIV